MQEKGLQEVKVLAKAEDAEMLGQSQWPGCLEPQGRVGCSGWIWKLENLAEAPSVLGGGV